MMVKKCLVMAVAALWLSGCQTLPPAPAALENTPPEQATTAAVAAANEVPERVSPLLADIVYSVLAGDIASQRDNYPEAYKHYLYAARLSRHAGLAELATKSALATRDEEAAQQAVEFWVELTPDHVGALQIAALLKAREGDREGAAAHLRRVVEIRNGQGENGYLDVARLLTKINDTGLRLSLIRRLTAEREDDPQALFALALVEMGSGNLELAEAAVRRVLLLRPDWNQARVLLVRTLGAQNKKQAARVTLKQFLHDYPQDTRLRAAYARLLLEQEDLAGARQQFERLLKEDPENGDTLFALGVLAVHEQRSGAAKEYFLRLYATGEHKNDSAFYLGQILENEGDGKGALTWYEKVRGSNLLDARVRIARILAGRGEVSRAREIIQQLRTRTPKESIQLDLIEGEILSEIEHYQAAIDVFTRALEEHPGNPELLYARALTAVHIDRIDVLERDLQRILERDPDHADALNALGYTLADRTDRYQEALGFIERALRLKPDSAAVLDSMGWVHYRLGNNREALRYLWRAMELVPDAEIAAHLGEVLWQQGERKRARQVWDEALRKEPDSKYLLQVLERYQ